VASHDLQEPLRKIRAFGDRLAKRAERELSTESQDYIRRMSHAAERMQRLINDLLMFSRVQTRATPFQPVNLDVVVSEVLGDLETRIEQTGAVVEVGPLPTIMADPLQMRQLLQNLLGNALKFHEPEQPPRVKVGAEQVPGEGPGAGLWRVTVEDNGIGFDEKYLDRIFNVFQRLHGRGVYEGTGIGLAICRRIVERHGGTLEAHSSPGKGSTFVVTLSEEPAAGALAGAPAGANEPALETSGGKNG
jgi:light-regulated signal transduction histidine kinase (bacteriophytochrome)